ncbi:MAG TPA: acetyl-CoA carboxylase biotin carboxyl carrier protein [Gemmatimonadales bacterium]|jgi:acetyl-CoA carboxylase biotin carboxyl carrier protein|nr:acetyl-CoA carboxylase biotin carboxyl carrier protein [Gemmatimonadales bacterium]
MNADEMRQLAQLLEKMPGLKSVELKDVKRLAELLRESPEIGSIEVKGFFGTGIVITRTAQGLAAPMAWAPPAMPAPAPASAAAPAAAATPAASAPSHLKEIKSPMVGTFYRAPEPGAEAYAKVGTRVAPGQTVCIIEAMKIMNEIEAEFAGVVTEVCVDDAQPVEFGQVLFRIDPNG